MPSRPLSVRFWEKVRKTESCWLWMAHKNWQGYGSIRVGDRRVTAPRVSWELANGPIPEGMCVLHRCDNPVCVNPEHLFLGTQKDNMYDRTVKGRDYRGQHDGERNGNHKLAWDDVEAIRALYRVDIYTGAELAQAFQVATPTIDRIVYGRSWHPSRLLRKNTTGHMPPGRPPHALAERFWKKVQKTNSCWTWIGCKNRTGYGIIRLEPRNLRAHRVSWELVNGPIPDGMHVLHRCDNPTCVNPAHLYLGTQKDNIQDAASKGRLRRN